MNRPTVSVVMPFAGDLAAARAAVATLLALETRPGDELILSDNSDVVRDARGVNVVSATAERSPAHARNAGAEQARGEWILFVDADCRVPRTLLGGYFAEPIADDIGALAGDVRPTLDGQTLVQRYGAARGFLNQRAHLQHPFKPRAVAANLMVRRSAFEQVGGFLEGLRAAEDTDLSWRIQEAGWRLELRPEAWVEHRYRTTLSDLRRQWRGYAAGRAWLARRYEGFEPKSGLRRAAQRLSRRGPQRDLQPQLPRVGPPGPPDPAELSSAGSAAQPSRPGPSRLERVCRGALDGLLGFEELRGLALSNRPRESARGPASVVLVADRFPAPEDPLLDLARALDGARVEAVARPGSFAPAAARGLRIDYREDDGAAARVLSAAVLVVRHPLRSALDRLRRRPGAPTLAELAPAGRRLYRDAGARLHPLGGDCARETAGRLAALAGRTVSDASSNAGRGWPALGGRG
ncbi:MAG TPA: glycosyltransferase [Solirubrobacteraceae bacterium]